MARKLPESNATGATTDEVAALKLLDHHSLPDSSSDSTAVKSKCTMRKWLLERLVGVLIGEQTGGAERVKQAQSSGYGI